MTLPDLQQRLARAKYRAWHRGTREADYMIGGFFDARHQSWSEAELALFEELIDEDDVDIMAWALGTAEAPEKYAGPLIEALKKLDYVTI
ncbi:succinate dehydrogenase assembly factor 2 [Altererythrobacter soli]|uniref:FAD assembly factor SdhE n=1 Tax=Croceibacterium soli TaxID=1739690 RepID=A0A6I4UX01_9SPHN|nr:succinate dehydrogenase assembly factor 2 [Croceibacterium soli]MXP42434.1 succinate dehydrogenase assembly factor 2 [Croceibacterium soli]